MTALGETLALLGGSFGLLLAWEWWEERRDARAIRRMIEVAAEANRRHRQNVRRWLDG